MEGFGCGLAVAFAVQRPLAWPSLGVQDAPWVPVCPLFTWLLLLCAGIRQLELSQEEDSKSQTGFK